MTEIEFLCLAVFRGKPIWSEDPLPYYVVGIDLSNEHYVRLVSDQAGHPLKSQGLRCSVRGLPQRMKPLDVVSLTLDAPAPDKLHPENWVLGSGEGHISFLRTVSEDECLSRLIRRKAEETTGREDLFGSETSYVTSDIGELKSSVLVFRPGFLVWRKTREFTKGRVLEVDGRGTEIKGEFRFGLYESPYALPVVDPFWERKIECNLPGSGHMESNELFGRIDGTTDEETLLVLAIDDCISVPDQPYKVIAGVLRLPRLEDTVNVSNVQSMHNEA